MQILSANWAQGRVRLVSNHTGDIGATRPAPILLDPITYPRVLCMGIHVFAAANGRLASVCSRKPR